MVDHIEPDPNPDELRPEERPEGGAPREESKEGVKRDSWLDEGYPLVDADFVGSTLERVLHDRSEIESEAARVDQFRFEEGFLAYYSEPKPSTGFVEETLERVAAERADGRCIRTDEEHEFHVLMEHAHVPEPGADYVDRTLSAVLRNREEQVTASSRTLVGRPFSLVASIAALVLCAVVILWKDGSASVTAPIPWGSLVTDVEGPDRNFVLPIVVQHPITDFVLEVREDK